MSVAVPAALVHDNGAPKDVTATARVTHDGPDAAPADNTATATTRVYAEADVRVTGVTTTGPVEVLLGQSGTLTTSTTIDSLGPSSPIDTRLTTSAQSPGVTVTPAVVEGSQLALAIGPARTVTTARSVRCDQPGPQTVTVTASLALVNAADVDPVLSNNVLSSNLTIDCIIPIAINVRPGGTPNSVNLNTDATLAALTTRAGEYGLPLAVDATRIVATTARWGLRSNLFGTTTPTGAEEVHRRCTRSGRTSWTTARGTPTSTRSCTSSPQRRG